MSSILAGGAKPRQTSKKFGGVYSFTSQFLLGNWERTGSQIFESHSKRFVEYYNKV